MDKQTKKQLQTHVLEYLKKKVPGFKIKKRGMFQCPFSDRHKNKTEKLTANIFPKNTYQVFCFDPNCKKLGDIFDLCREIEFCGNKDVPDEDIAEHLKELLDITTNDKIDKMLAKYHNWGWDLVPIAKNEKRPIEKEWTNKVHKDVREWKEWLSNKLNVGVKTGKISNIVIIDIDQKEIPETLKELLNSTVVQKTNKGWHYIYQYDEDFPKTSINIDGAHIDIETDGGQCVIEPSEIDEIKRKITGETINKMNEKLKKFLISKIETPKEKIVSSDDDLGKIKGLEGNCNNTFARVGGVFKKFMNTDQIERALFTINRYMLDDPMDTKSVKQLCSQINKYYHSDLQNISEKILTHMKIVNEAHIRDLRECLGFDRKDLEKALKSLCEQKKLYKIAKDLYKLIQDVEWQEDFLSVSKPLKYNVPFFNDYAEFNNGSIIIIGGASGSGKSHLTMNFIREFVNQGVYPYLITTEAGSGFDKIAQRLQLKEGDFGFFKTNNPIHVPFKKDAVTIIDWLKPPQSDYAKTDLMYQQLNDKMVEKGGLLIVFTQLKTVYKMINGEEKATYSFYAENMTEFYASLVAKFLYTNVNGKLDNLHPYFKTQKIRNSKRETQYLKVPLEYNPETKRLKKL